MNLLMFTGRLAKDPELKKSSNKEIPYVHFTIAVRKPYKSDMANWISLTAWNQNAKFLSQYCGKGDLIEVQAHMESYHSENEEGEKIYRTMNVADRIQILAKVHRDSQNRTAEEYDPDLDPEQMAVDASFEQDYFSDDDLKGMEGFDDLPWE